jgi:hypothetical protein
MIERRAIQCIALGVAAFLLVAPSAAFGQQIFADDFAAYVEGTGQPDLLAVWPLDGCDSGKIENDGTHVWSVPNSIAQAKGDFGFVGARHRHDLTPAEIQGAAVVNDPNANVIYGTDANPLILEYYIDLGTQGWWRHNRFMEITCGTDRAPTPMIDVTCPEDGSFRRYIDPAGDSQVHASIAVGVIAARDPNPCHTLATNDNQHQVYRLVVYGGGPDPAASGRSWHILQNYPNLGDDLRICQRINRIKIYIKSTTVDVEMTSRYNPGTGACDSSTTYNVTIPRFYFGPFNSLVMGGIVVEDAVPPEPACWREDSSGASIPSTTYKNWIDNIELTGGEAGFEEEPCGVPIPPGACCLPNGTCQDNVDFDTCTETLNGEFNGPASTCAASSCCLDPVFDAVGGGVNGDEPDGAVDQQDFGYFQTCITGPTDPDNVFDVLPDKCRCMDLTSNTPGVSDNAIDQNEFGIFQICSTGPSPGTPVDPACDDVP